MAGKPMCAGNKLKIMWAGNKIKKGMWAGNVIYSAGSTVTYHVDTGVAYQEEVEDGEPCLSPKTFAPAKSGWTFAGWRTDASASGDVLGSLAMGDDPVTLYAVFKKSVTVTYYNGSTAPSAVSGYRYYNNGNVADPSFTLNQAALSGWTARGWSTGAAGDSGITYNNGAAFTRASNITLYGMYQQAITVTYYNASTAASTASGTRYYNSGSGNVANPAFALSQNALPGWTARGWSTSLAADGGITYANGAAFARDSNVTLYGMYQQTVTVTYYNAGMSASSTAGTRYYNPGSGNVADPSFTLNQAALPGWTARGWSASAAGDGGIAYANGAAFTRASNITLYGMYHQSITLTYYNGSAAPASTIGTRYYNPGSGGVVDPAFTLYPAALPGWTFRGWAVSSDAAAGIAYSSISNTAFAASAAVYACYYQTITLSYGGNGATGGYTAAQTGTRYFNSGNVADPSFIVSGNGFERSGYTWQQWRLGSASGTAYYAGAVITLSADATLYAEWLADNLMVYSKYSMDAPPAVNNAAYCSIYTGTTDRPSSSITIPVPGHVKFAAGGVYGGETYGYSYISISLGAYKSAAITIVPYFAINDDDSGDANEIQITGAASGDGIYGFNSSNGIQKMLNMTVSGTITVKHKTGWLEDNTSEYWIQSIVLSL